MRIPERQAARGLFLNQSRHPGGREKHHHGKRHTGNRCQQPYHGAAQCISFSCHCQGFKHSNEAGCTNAPLQDAFGNITHILDIELFMRG
jgi:hypothetical protein